MAALIDELRQASDLLLLSGPALLSGSDSASLAEIADGLLLFVDERTASRKTLRRARGWLDLLDCRVVGVVVTERRRTRAAALARRAGTASPVVDTRAGSRASAE